MHRRTPASDRAG